MGRFQRFASTAAVAAVLGLAPAAAQAATITVFTNQALWQAAVGGPVTTETFADAVLEPGLSIVGGSVSIGGGVLNDQINDDGATSTTFSFATPIGAFGGLFNLAGPGGQGSGIRVNVDFFGGGSQLAGDIPATTNGTFWGFVSDVAITSVRFSETNPAVGVETYTLDDLQFAAVPEPATLALLGLGAAVFARRRTRR